MGKFKYVILSVLAFGFISMNVACSKKSSSSDNGGAVYNPNVIGPGGVIGNCQNCNFAQVQLFNITTQASASGVQINWQVTGDQSAYQYAQQMAQYSGTNPVKLYQGPAAMVGSMTVSQDLMIGQCVVPAGQYQISTTQAGTASSGPRFDIPQIVMVNSSNGVQIVAQLYNAIPVFDGYSGQIRNLFGYVILQQAPVYQYGYGNGQPVTGAMGSCNNAYFSFGSTY